MENLKFVNLGTEEEPMEVPEKALNPDTPEGAGWWEMVVSGSVLLERETLERLLEVANAQDQQGK